MTRGKIIPAKGLSYDTVIYRTISVKRLLQLFNDKTNAVVRPSMWPDTFENLALRSIVDVNGEAATFSFPDDIYGQCWTLHTASDAIWRIYSKGTNGIRIKSTVGKLFESLASSSPEGAKGETFIGKVRYLKNVELLDFASTHFPNSGLSTESIAETLTIKRRAFVHEKEVRLIYISDKRRDEGVLPYAIEPNELIDQIMIHPQLPLAKANELKKRIKVELGFKNAIKQSQLYSLPKGFVFQL